MSFLFLECSSPEIYVVNSFMSLLKFYLLKETNWSPSLLGWPKSFVRVFPHECMETCHHSLLVFCRSILSHLGLSRWCSGKESACQCRKCKRHRFDPWIGKILGVGHGNLLQYSWKIPWTEEPGRLQSIVSLRVGHDWVRHTHILSHLHIFDIYTVSVTNLLCLLLLSPS